jgi:hypothetical protein
MNIIKDIKNDFKTMRGDFDDLPKNLKIVAILYFLLCPFTFLAAEISAIIFPLISIFSINNKCEIFKETDPDIRSIFFFVILFISLIVVSFIWSPSIKLYSKCVAPFLLIIMIFFLYYNNCTFLSDKIKKIFLFHLIFGMFISSLILISESAFLYPYAHFRNKSPEALYHKISLWIGVLAPIILLIKIPKKWKFIFIITSLFSLSLKLSDTAIVSCLIGIIACFFLKFHRKIKIILFSYITLCLFFLPFFLKLFFKYDVISFLEEKCIITQGSYYHRLQIWEKILTPICNQLFNVRGVNAIREKSVTGGGTEVMIKNFTTNEVHTFFYNFGHPHNAVLQLWLDLGGIGVIIFFIICILVLKVFFRNFQRYRIMILFFISLQPHFLFCINLWHPWWWSFVFLVFPLLMNNEEEPLSLGEDSTKPRLER